jgi:hypothetical protein
LAGKSLGSFSTEGGAVSKPYMKSKSTMMTLYETSWTLKIIADQFGSFDKEGGVVTMHIAARHWDECWETS